MPRYIDTYIAVAQITRLKDNDSSKYDLGLDTAINEIKYHMPTADVVEVKRGKWINDKGLYKCSACNELWTVGWASCIPIKQMYKEVQYCPHCGAKMEGEKEIENLLDQCDGECDYCKYAVPVQIGVYPDGEPRYASTGLGGEYYKRCTLTEEND